MKKRILVPATITLDATGKSVTFDAAPVLKHYSTSNFAELQIDGLSRGYVSDRVALESKDKAVIALLALCEPLREAGVENYGYEVQIDENALLRWLKKVKPKIHALWVNAQGV